SRSSCSRTWRPSACRRPSPQRRLRCDGMGDLAPAPRPADRHGGAPRRARRRRRRNQPADPRGVPPRHALGVPAADLARRLRHHRPALPRPVRRLGHRPPRPRRAARARRPLRRGPASRARARARDASLRLDAERDAPALLALATVCAAAITSALVMWWRCPFDTLQGRMPPSGFDVEGVVVPAYALFALAVGVLAGLLLRRTVAAMTVTLLVFVATRLAVASFLRPRFEAPLHRTALATDTGRQVGDWILSDTLVDAAGRQITAGREDLAVLHAQQAGIDPHAYLVSVGWKRAISYQPAGRFWEFQLVEAGLFAALAVAVVLTAIWLVRRTPS